MSIIEWLISAFKADSMAAGRTLCVEPVGEKVELGFLEVVDMRACKC